MSPPHQMPTCAASSQFPPPPCLVLGFSLLCFLVARLHPPLPQWITMNGQQYCAQTRVRSGLSTTALGTATEKLISGTPPRPAHIFLVGDQKSSCLESVRIHVETLLTRTEDFKTLGSSHVTGSSVTISQESRKPTRGQLVTETAGLP